jgi:lysophospholipase L1-like esterase
MTLLRNALLLTISATALWAQSPFYLKDGDRVVFYGDSITEQRLYTVFTEAYTVTRFPQISVKFTHAGWGGDRVSGGGGGPIDKRLQRDVLPYKPNVVTIMLGMNDGGYRSFDQKIFDAYATGYKHIVESLKSNLPGIRITAIQPSPYDDVNQPPKFEGGYNAVLVRYSEFIRDLTAQEKIDTADLNAPVVADLKRAREKEPAEAAKIVPDRVHPGPAGHMLMAEHLLRAWHAQALVSDIEIDAKNDKVVKSANSQIDGLNGTSWIQTDRALPMPIDWKDSTVTLAINSSDFLETLDQELLRVTGLSEGQWKLKIDGEEVFSFDSEELAKGINLARFNTPMMKQAMNVLALTRKHVDTYYSRWRGVQVPFENDNFPEKETAMKALDSIEAQILSQQRKAAQPARHRFDLVKAS